MPNQFIENRIKELRKLFGEVSEGAILTNLFDREFCSMCGHPTSADSEFKNIEIFLRQSLELQKQKMIEGINKAQTTCIDKSFDKAIEIIKMI